MKRSLFKSSTKPLVRSYLQRRTPLRPASPKKIADKRAKLGLADPEYLAWIRTLRCSVCQILDRLHAHHLKHGHGERRGGMGIRVHDRLSLPMCPRHHRQFHRSEGYFKAWPKEQKRVWQEERIERLLKRFARLKAGREE